MRTHGLLSGLVLVCGLSAASAALADGALSPPPGAPAPEADTPTPRTRLLVLEPTSTVLDQQTITTLAGLMVVDLSQRVAVDVISPADVRRLAELESDKQALGCLDSSCLAELAGALGARYVVFGDIGQLGGTLVMNLNLFDNATARAVSRVTVQGPDAGALGAALPDKMKGLIEPLVDARVFSESSSSSSSSSSPSSSSSSSSSSSLSGSFPIVPVLLGASAVVTAGVGAGLDIFLPTSSNKTYDPADFIGPGLYVVAAGLGVGAVVTAFAGDDDAP